jgi:hypothetical protein
MNQMKVKESSSSPFSDAADDITLKLKELIRVFMGLFLGKWANSRRNDEGQQKN